MDKKCGAPWQVAVGEGFGFDVTHTRSNMICKDFDFSNICAIDMLTPPPT